MLDGEKYSITTPFLDNHNDNIEIYVVKDEVGFILSDDGFTIRNLEMSGMDFSSSKKQLDLEKILNNFNVILGENHQLMKGTSVDDLGRNINSLIQTIISVNAFEYLT